MKTSAGHANAYEESGQSLIEFLLMLPALVGLTMIMIRMNTAVQMSIVNQQYARAQALFLAFNSPVFPERAKIQEDFVPKQMNQMVLGVADNAFPNEGDEDYQPEASTQIVTRTISKAGGKPPVAEERAELGTVRIRNTVSICTQLNVIKGDGSRYVPLVLGPNTSPSSFDYCRSPLDEQ